MFQVRERVTPCYRSSRGCLISACLPLMCDSSSDAFGAVTVDSSVVVDYLKEIVVAAYEIR
jgi:hypothetical protein